MGHYAKGLKNEFGEVLSTVIERDGTQLPLVVETCIDFLHANSAHETEGIFRKSGNAGNMRAIKEQFDKSNDAPIGQSPC